MYRSGDAEVLQLVVKKVDFIIAALSIQLAQGIAERHIIIFARNFLRLTLDEGKTKDNDEDDSFHGLLNDDFAFFEPYVQALKAVQLLNGVAETILAFPNEMKAQLSGFFATERDFRVVV